MVESNAKDIFNVGFILLVSGVIAVAIQLVFPSQMITRQRAQIGVCLQ